MGKCHGIRARKAMAENQRWFSASLTRSIVPVVGRKSRSEEIARSIQSFFPDTDLELMTMVVERYKEQDTWAKDPIMKSESLDRLQK